MDNKLAACHTPVMTYPTPSPSGEEESSVPVLIFKIEKIPYKSPYALVFKVSEVVCRIMYRVPIPTFTLGTKTS